MELTAAATKPQASTPTKPRLIAHHKGRSWTSFWYDAEGAKRTKRFGREGEVSAREAKARYETWLETEWRRYESVRNPTSAPAIYTVDTLAEDYTAYAQSIYRKGEKETGYALTVEYALDTLKAHHGGQPADTLTNPQLAKLRDAMIHKADGKARSLSTVNDRLHAIQQAYKWARERGYVSAATLNDLLAVSRLKRGRSEAKDPRDVLPIAVEIVEATLKQCPPTLAAMIRVQLLAGMRPGEVCIMRPMDIEAGGKVWLYRPSRHKLEHKGIERVVPLGPQAQEVIKPFLQRDLAGFLFTPAEAQAQRLATKHASRKTPATYGNAPGTNRVENPERIPGEVYTVESYRKAIHHACRKAAIRDEAGKVVLWNPNQLRHTAATSIRKEFGIEEASAVLGHTNLSTTEIYAEASLDRAMGVALRVG